MDPIDWTAGQPVSLVASLQAPAPERLEPLGLSLELQGPSQQLATGLLLLEWRPRAASAPGTLGTDAASPGATSWRADHAIGQGMVRAPHQPKGRPSPGGLRIQEQLALQLPAPLAPGTYQLHAQLLTPKGQVLPLKVTSPTIQVEAGTGKPIEAPPLAANRITVLRHLGQQLRAGQLDPLFARIGQLNQTDPGQVYLRDGAAILRARLRQDPRNLDDLYALALAQALQRQAGSAAATLARILPLDPTNPNALLGLGVVDLYRFKPGAAKPLLERAAQLDPNNETLRTLRIVASAMGLDWGHALSLLKS